MHVPRVASMLFVPDVRNACIRIKSRLPEESPKFMNLVKTTFSVIAATK